MAGEAWPDFARKLSRVSTGLTEQQTTRLSISRRLAPACKTHDGYLSRSKEVSRVNRIFNFFFSLRREEGQTMAEYGVVLAVITVALVTAFGLLSNKIGVAINNVANVIK
jgi:Flp pilus assembly pilin Flp